MINEEINKNIRLRTLKRRFMEVAPFFDKEIWFVRSDNSVFEKKIHSSKEVIQELFYYFDLIDVGIFDLKEYFISAALFVNGSYEVKLFLIRILEFFSNFSHLSWTKFF
jgi:hypothetical protein